MTEKTRNIKLTLRVTSQEHEQIKLLAGRKTVAKYIRDIATSTPSERRKNEHEKVLQDVRFELSKIGTNLNQIAKKLNTIKNDNQLSLTLQHKMTFDIFNEILDAQNELIQKINELGE